MNVIFRVRLVELVGTTILFEKSKHVKESSKNAKQKKIILEHVYIVPFEHLN